jgi:hypothetical protein
MIILLVVLFIVSLTVQQLVLSTAMLKVAPVTVLWQMIMQVLAPAFIFNHTISNPLSNF